MRFGQIKTFAHRFVNGRGIPVFADRRTNRAIDQHVDRILRARTRRKSLPPKGQSLKSVAGPTQDARGC